MYLTNGQLKKILSLQESMEKEAKKVKEMQDRMMSEVNRFKYLEERLKSSLLVEEIRKQSERQQKYFLQISDQVERFNVEGVFAKISKVEKYLKRQEEFNKSLIEITKGWEKVNKICLELGWFPCGQWGSEAGRTILKLYKEKKIGQLENAIYDFYDERIINISVSWNDCKDLDKRRLNISKQAVMAHLNGYYETSIIVLYSQIEGQIRDKLLIKGKANYSKLFKKYEINIKSGEQKQFLKEVYVDIILSSMLKKVYQRHGQKLTRNGALHGFYLGPYDRIQSMKLILLFNFVVTTNIWTP